MSMLLQKISDAKAIAISGHLNPDGDCIGSCLALYNYIIDNYKDKKVDVFLEKAPARLEFLAGYDKVKHELPSQESRYNLFVSLDCADVERLGNFKDILKMSDHSFCADHHRTNMGFADMNIVAPDAASTSELLFTMLDEEKISLETARCLYTGIIHDTGVFEYPSTTQKTLDIAGRLIAKGVDFASIIAYSFRSKTYAQAKLLACAVANSKLYFDGKVIASFVPDIELEKNSAEKSDLNGIVSELLNVDGVECSVFIHKNQDDSFKVSLRSKKYVDVSEIASTFSGGGHVRAAGYTAYGTLRDVALQALMEIKKKIR